MILHLYMYVDHCASLRFSVKPAGLCGPSVMCGRGPAASTVECGAGGEVYSGSRIFVFYVNSCCETHDANTCAVAQNGALGGGGIAHTSILSGQ